MCAWTAGRSSADEEGTSARIRYGLAVTEVPRWRRWSHDKGTQVENENQGLSLFFGTITLAAAGITIVLALAVGYFLGHFSNPKHKTVTIARLGVPGMPPLATAIGAPGAGGGAAPGTSTPTTTTSTATAPATTTTSTATTPTSTTEAKKTSTSGAATAKPPKTGKSPTASGVEVFTANCASCHTLKAAGSSGTTGPNLDSLKPDTQTVANQVTNGGGGMPAFGKILSDDEIQAVAAYVSKVAGSQP